MIFYYRSSDKSNYEETELEIITASPRRINFTEIKNRDIRLSQQAKTALVPRTGVEPVISGMKTQRPRPLDERGVPCDYTQIDLSSQPLLYSLP